MPGFPLARGSAWAGGRVHTPSRVPQRWGTTSCREAAPLTDLRGGCSFASLPAHLLPLLVAEAELVRFPRRALVVQEGTAADACYVVLRGAVHMRRLNTVVRKKAGAGSLGLGRWAAAVKEANDDGLLGLALRANRSRRESFVSRTQLPTMTDEQVRWKESRLLRNRRG
jgi:hypothetical protein